MSFGVKGTSSDTHNILLGRGIVTIVISFFNLSLHREVLREKDSDEYNIFFDENFMLSQLVLIMIP
jgi:hypothetical protein